MATSDKSRRTLGRLSFRMPRPARFATYEIILVDLSARGAGIRHHQKIPPNIAGDLEFDLELQQHEVKCVLSRSRLELVRQGDQTLQIYRSALRFVAMGIEGTNERVESIRQAMKQRVERAVIRQQVEGSGDPKVVRATVESDGATPVGLVAPSTERPFVRYTPDEKGHWNMEQVEIVEQPSNGFTVSAEEGEKDIGLLRKAWEVADEDQRRLIKIFAQLALTDPSVESLERHAT